MRILKLLICFVIVSIVAINYVTSQVKYLENEFDYTIIENKWEKARSARKYFNRLRKQISADSISHYDSLYTQAAESISKLTKLYSHSHSQAEWIKSWREDEKSNRMARIWYLIVLFIASGFGIRLIILIIRRNLIKKDDA